MTNATDNPPAASKKTGCGCIGNTLIALATLAIVLLLSAWLVVMHTAWPLRRIAALMEGSGAGSHLKITGVSGSLSSGGAFKSMVWDDGELSDVRIRYSGPGDLFLRKKLILSEVHVGKAHINASFKDGSSSGETPDSEPTSASAGGGSGDWPLKLLQIDRLTLEDIVLTDTGSDFRFEIPKLEWTGFVAEKGNVRFGSLDADTDHFKLSTVDSPEPGFQRRIEGSILPKAHPRLLKPIGFQMDLGMEGGGTKFRLFAFDKHLDIVAEPDGTGWIRTRGLNLADFIDAPLPQDLTVEMLSSADAESGDHRMDLKSGSFRLGLRKFEIEIPEPGVAGSDPKAALLHALSGNGAEAVRYDLLETGVTGTAFQKLTSTPPSDIGETLSQVYYGKPYGELSSAEKTDIEAKKPWFAEP